MRLKSIIIILLLLSSFSLEGKRLMYMEEFYRIYYLPSYYNKYDLRRNLVWLQTALKCHFAPPINALVITKTEREYEKYQMLIMMHINFLMTQNSVFLGAEFDKHEPVFFNKPFRKDILKSLEWARYYYKTALNYWAVVLEHKAIVMKYKDVDVDMKFANDLIYRIEVGDVDYKRVVNRKLKKIEKTIEFYENMD